MIPVLGLLRFKMDPLTLWTCILVLSRTKRERIVASRYVRGQSGSRATRIGHGTLGRFVAVCGNV